MIKALVSALIIFSVYSWAQDVDSSDYIDEIGDSIFFTSEESDESEFIEYFEHFFTEPVNINTANREKLSAVPFLSITDADKIIIFRTRFGVFFSKSELYMVKDIPAKRIKMILPFITTEDIATPNSVLSGPVKINFKSRIRKRNLSSSGELSEWSNLNRLKINFGDAVAAGFSTEKDDGEKLLADYYSGFIHLKNLTSMNSVIIGDYLIEEGQGLLLWGTYGMPKNSYVISSVFKKAKGIRPNTGTNEMNFFRGIAAENIGSHFTLRGFLSSRNIDASIDADGNIIKLLKDGYHRSSTEMERKNTVLSKTAGGSVAYNNDFISIGSSFFITSFDKIFNGKDLIEGLSINTSVTCNNIFIIGEAAYSYRSAIIAGVLITPVKELEFITLFRNYNPGYINLYGSGFGEKNRITQNEKGFYTGLSVKTGFTDLNFYIDQYSFPKSEYGNNSKNGFDLLINAVIPLKKQISISLTYKYDSGDKSIPSEEIINSGTRQKSTLRAEMKLDYGKGKIKFRCDYLKNKISNYFLEEGYLTMQDLKFDLEEWISVLGRISFYSTDSYQSALYFYDSGFPGLLESTAMYGDGLLISALLKLSINKRISFHLKYSETFMERPYRKTVPSIILQGAINY